MKIEIFTLNLEYEYQRDGLTVYTLHTIPNISRVAVKYYLDYYQNNGKYRCVTYKIKSEGIQKW
jgi:hypothetical protein